MSHALPIIVFIISVLLILKAILPPAAPSSTTLFKSKNLMTENEIEFYYRLKSALPNYIIMSQVAMGALMDSAVSRQVSSSDNWKIRAKFSQKIIDYVICDPMFNVIALIELDDKTHSKENDKVRDAMTAQAGYKTIRYESKNKPSPDQIATDIKNINNLIND